MAKKRRHGCSSHPSSSKMKYESRGDDVMVARDRLKGALEGLVHSEDESSSSVEEAPIVTPCKSTPLKKDIKIVRRRKRKVPVEEEVAFHNEFVMKLFDRSVNFARFQEDTPLYPICRAWMANVPRVTQTQNDTTKVREEVTIKQENDAPMDLDTLDDVYQMPRPSCPPWVSRIPSAARPELKGVNLDYDSENVPSAEELLKEHGGRWKQTRQKWIEAAQMNDSRYQNSIKLLSNIYKRYQVSLT